MSSSPEQSKKIVFSVRRVLGITQLPSRILLDIRSSDVSVVLQQTHQFPPYIRQRPSGDANHRVPRRLLKPKKNQLGRYFGSKSSSRFFGLLLGIDRVFDYRWRSRRAPRHTGVMDAVPSGSSTSCFKAFGMVMLGEIQKQGVRKHVFSASDVRCRTGR